MDGGAAVTELEGDLKRCFNYQQQVNAVRCMAIDRNFQRIFGYQLDLLYQWWVRHQYRPRGAARRWGKGRSRAAAQRRARREAAAKRNVTVSI